MRKFRNAALAGATAVALTFGATSVANATLSSEIGAAWNADQPVNGRDVFGSTTLEVGEQGTLEDGTEYTFPEWAGNMRAITYAGIAIASLAAIAAPVYNFIAYNNILPLPKF
ncbi:hypothetical protein [Corynebacterium epidermidicanis]|uniref:Or membrane protein n=1 Tax=Corynebacterium epidermidicanis TaxID=1050174 RepID=A0A0G3GN96_9CORY|nr:hypothetical protein [Corynebacterium epidermidicanis]AKK02040.1 hypothetical protein CEPID_00730 [Corynebacterium epidermidicanis]MDU0479753.1 hypothetical protein [Staphylococcus chromogenes]